MEVLVAGATGVLGRRTVRLLLEAGHGVTGTARSSDAARAVAALGARPAPVDLFDPQSVREVVAGNDAVVNLTTSIPPFRKAARDVAWRTNHRLRERVAGVLVDSSLATGVTTFVQESIVFPYPDRGEAWIGEDEAFGASPHTAPARAAEAAVERFRAAGRTGTVLRFGMLYSADGEHALAMASMARRGIAPLLGDPAGFVSMVHADDAAAAALTAPSGTYNVVDDEPLRRSEFHAVLGAALGRRPPRRVPSLLARLGGPYLEVLSRSQRVSNARLRAATSWVPTYTSARVGWPAVIADWRDRGLLPAVAR